MKNQLKLYNVNVMQQNTGQYEHFSYYKFLMRYFVYVAVGSDRVVVVVVVAGQTIWPISSN